MPQGVELHIPFPSRVSPDCDRAQVGHLEWARSFGIFPTEQAESRHVQGGYVELAGRLHPSATGINLDLGVDHLSWFFIFDDQFDVDGPYGRDPVRAKQLTDAVADVLCGLPDVYPINSASIVAAFADLWRRSCEGMSMTWRTRAAQNWRAYLSAYVTEAANRCRPAGLSLADQLALRKNTIGVGHILDLAERLGHFEVPEQAYRGPLMTTMRRIAAEVVALDNDIVSAEKEEATGDCNLLLYIERESRCSRAQAIDTVCKMVHERTERFLALEHEFPSLCDSLDLDETGRAAIRRYQADALRAVMRGAYDWQRKSGRYTTSYLSPLGSGGRST